MRRHSGCPPACPILSKRGMQYGEILAPGRLACSCQGFEHPHLHLKISSAALEHWKISWYYRDDLKISRLALYALVQICCEDQKALKIEDEIGTWDSSACEAYHQLTSTQKLTPRFIYVPLRLESSYYHCTGKHVGTSIRFCKKR